MKVAHITDCHVDFLKNHELIEFLLSLQESEAEAFVITGDISKGTLVHKHLLWMEKIVQKPIYFVLGNHDFYDSSFAEVNKNIRKLCEESNYLFYLQDREFVKLGDTILIGQNGWYDAGWRTPLTSLVFLWDWLFIEEFHKLSNTQARIALLIEIAASEVRQAERKLLEALKHGDKIMFATHIPPWSEDHYKLGEIANKFWMPYNSSKMMADMLVRVMEKHPNKQLTCTAGHVHLRRKEQITHNILLKVGDGAHGKSKIEEIIDL